MTFIDLSRTLAEHPILVVRRDRGNEATCIQVYPWGNERLPITVDVYWRASSAMPVAEPNVSYPVCMTSCPSFGTLRPPDSARFAAALQLAHWYVQQALCGVIKPARFAIRMVGGLLVEVCALLDDGTAEAICEPERVISARELVDDLNEAHEQDQVELQRLLDMCMERAT